MLPCIPEVLSFMTFSVSSKNPHHLWKCMCRDCATPDFHIHQCSWTCPENSRLASAFADQLQQWMTPVTAVSLFTTAPGWEANPALTQSPLQTQPRAHTAAQPGLSHNGRKRLQGKVTTAGFRKTDCKCWCASGFGMWLFNYWHWDVRIRFPFFVCVLSLTLHS